MWVVSGSDGLVLNFEMYQGKSQDINSQLGVTDDLVLHFCSGIEGLNYKLFLDHFTSPVTNYY